MIVTRESLRAAWEIQLVPKRRTWCHRSMPSSTCLRSGYKQPSYIVFEAVQQTIGTYFCIFVLPDCRGTSMVSSCGSVAPSAGAFAHSAPEDGKSLVLASTSLGSNLTRPGASTHSSYSLFQPYNST